MKNANPELRCSQNTRINKQQKGNQEYPIQIDDLDTPELFDVT
jgi:hypothetical protein